MKKMILALMATMMMAGALYAQTPTSSYENYIQVTGKAEREIVPDEIYIRIIINESDTKGKVSLEQQTRKMISTLKSLGIDTEKNLKVGDMSSDFQKLWLKKSAARTSATYQLKVNSAEMLAKVIEALNDIDISNIDITKVTHSKIKEYMAEIRIEAMKNAQQIASSLAEAVDQKAGRAILIVDYNNEAVPYNNVMLLRTKNTAMAADAAVAEEASTLEFRNIKLTYSVNAKFALE